MPLGAWPNRPPVMPEGWHPRVTERAAPRLARGIPNCREWYHTARGIADRRSDVERCHEST